nr:unnamed protein product [Digitaria exilis]
MKPQVLLVAMAVLAVARGEWPCCDTCGACTRSFPPQCLCRDTSLDGCHPKCEKCVESSEDVFYCADCITNFCKRRCTRAA